MTTQTSRFPWEELTVPSSAGEYEVRLVARANNPESRRIFWGRSWQERPALLVDYKDDAGAFGPVPRFNGMRIDDHREEQCLVLELLDANLEDLFHKVCLDIISTLQRVPESSCRGACLLRLERWSSFLRPSRSRLSEESQKGLIAELHLLVKDMVEVLGPASALEGWTGPEAAPRDFAYGQTFVEAKSKRSSANPTIIVSSEDQLNVNPRERLFLYVEELNKAPADDIDSFTLPDVVAETRRVLGSPLLEAELDGKLAKVGYFDEDDYTDNRWTVGESLYYEVRNGFPRIESRSCAPGVGRVTYQIDLDYCYEYTIERPKVLGIVEK